VLALCERIVYQHSYAGIIAKPEGNKHPVWSPYDVVPALDGWVTIAAPSDVRWRTLCTLIGRPDLAADASLATNLQRVARRDEIFDLLAAWTSIRTKAEILDILGGHVPVGAVRDAAEIMADPHVAARDMVIQLEQPGTTTALGVAGQPLKFSRTPASPHRRAPLLDEDGPAIREALAQQHSAFRPPEATPRAAVAARAER
jgi:crotonobetainyl-CoA:carnitine CoA-transferase CaiB-like acyl-CoA transferase